MCQGPKSLGLERSWLISRMKKSAVWPVPSHPCSHPSAIFPPLQSCLQSSPALPPILHFLREQNLLNTYPSYLYLRLQMASLSSTIILHLLNFFSRVAIMLYFWHLFSPCPPPCFPSIRALLIPSTFLFFFTPLAPSCHLPALDVNTFLSGGNIL